MPSPLQKTGFIYPNRRSDPLGREGEFPYISALLITLWNKQSRHIEMVAGLAENIHLEIDRFPA